LPQRQQPLDTIEYMPNSFAQDDFDYEDYGHFSSDDHAAVLAQDQNYSFPIAAETSALA